MQLKYRATMLREPAICEHTVGANSFSDDILGLPATAPSQSFSFYFALTVKIASYSTAIYKCRLSAGTANWSGSRTSYCVSNRHDVQIESFSISAHYLT